MNKGWKYESHRHSLAARGIPTTHKQRYFFMKTQESNTPTDDPGIFGWRHKNDAIKTNHKLETVNRRKRVWLDRIERETGEGKLREGTDEAFLEMFKKLEEEYVNGQITQAQFNQEIESKGNFTLNNYSKTASAFDWSKPKSQEQVQQVKMEETKGAFAW